MVSGLRLPNIIHLRFLSALLKVVVHDNSLSFTDLKNIHTLIEKLDYVHYAKEKDIYAMIIAIKIISSGKINNIKDNDLHVTQVTSILPDVYTEILNDSVIPLIVTPVTISPEETSFVMRTVSIYLKYAFLMEDKDKVLNLFTGLASGSIHNVEDTIFELKTTIRELDKKIQSSETSDIDSTAIVHMTDPDFVGKFFKHAYNIATRPSRVLKLGLQRFNEFLSDDGGLLLGKMYTINAPTNSFKTGIMMYMAKWIQKYNSGVYLEEFQKTHKRPTVLFISLENTWDENTARFFSMYSGIDLGKVESFDEAATMWKRDFQVTDSIIDICMIFGKAGKFGTMDIERTIDDLETQGYTVIATLVDYLKILKDDSNNVDKRQQVIQISTDLHELVVRKSNMVLVTAHHTNRDGDIAISDTAAKGGVDKIKGLGRQHLTEAHGVEDSIDFSFYISPEVSPYNGKTYLAFKKGKCRYLRTKVEYFVHEMLKGFYIQDDLLLPESLSLNSVANTNPYMETAMLSNEKSIGKTKTFEGAKGTTSSRELNISINKAKTNTKSNILKIEDISLDVGSQFGNIEYMHYYQGVYIDYRIFNQKIMDEKQEIEFDPVYDEYWEVDGLLFPMEFKNK